VAGNKFQGLPRPVEERQTVLDRRKKRKGERRASGRRGLRGKDRRSALLPFLNAKKKGKKVGSAGGGKRRGERGWSGREWALVNV